MVRVKVSRELFFCVSNKPFITCMYFKSLKYMCGGSWKPEIAFETRHEIEIKIQSTVFQQMFTFGVCEHYHLEYSLCLNRLYSKWQCLQTPNVNIHWNTTDLSIDCFFNHYLNLKTIWRCFRSHISVYVCMTYLLTTCSKVFPSSLFAVSDSFFISEQLNIPSRLLKTITHIAKIIQTTRLRYGECPRSSKPVAG